MPLKLLSPEKAKKGPFWYVRGSYLGIRLNRSTKATSERVARQVFVRWRQQIERGEYERPSEPQQPAPATFVSAAVAYMKAGGERKHLGPIIEMRGPFALRDMPLADIDQIALDNAAAALYPLGSPQTRNRQFYTPVSAVMKRAGIKTEIIRPKGWRGNKSTSWLEPEQAMAVVAAGEALDAEFGLLLKTLLFTGMRLSEALNAKLRHLDLSRATLYLPETKNGDARMVYLPAQLVTALANQPPRPGRDGGRSRGEAGLPFLKRHPESKLFRFHAGGHLRDLLTEAMRDAGLSFPRRQGGFHLFCHTYGTWMHRYGGLDTEGLTRTKRWKDPRSADRYKHTKVGEEARRADLFPVQFASNGK
jgi:integrase